MWVPFSSVTVGLESSDLLSWLPLLGLETSEVLGSSLLALLVGDGLDVCEFAGGGLLLAVGFSSEGGGLFDGAGVFETSGGALGAVVGSAEGAGVLTPPDALGPAPPLPAPPEASCGRTKVEICNKINTTRIQVVDENKRIIKEKERVIGKRRIK